MDGGRVPLEKLEIQDEAQPSAASVRARKLSRQAVVRNALRMSSILALYFQVAASSTNATAALSSPRGWISWNIVDDRKSNQVHPLKE